MILSIYKHLFIRSNSLSLLTLQRESSVDVMPYGLKRSDLQLLAQAKLDDAKILLQASSFSNAYYIAGYAVEIGLKACIARQVTPETIPNKNFLQKVLNHEFMTLVSLAVTCCRAQK